MFVLSSLKDYHRNLYSPAGSNVTASRPPSLQPSELLILVRVLVHGVILVLGNVLEVNVAVLILKQLGELLKWEIRVMRSKIRQVCDIIDWDNLSWFCVNTGHCQVPVTQLVTCHVTVTQDQGWHILRIIFKISSLAVKIGQIQRTVKKIDLWQVHHRTLV